MVRGLCSELLWGATAGAATKLFGLVDNVEINGPEAPVQRKGLRGRARMVGPLLKPGGKVSFLPFDKEIFPHVLRARTDLNLYPCSVLSSFAVKAWLGKIVTLGDCAINEFTLTTSEGEALKAGLDWFCLTDDEVVYAAPPARSAVTPYPEPLHWESRDATATINATDFDIKGWTLKVSNSLAYRYGQDGSRLPVSIDVGDEIVTLEVTTWEPIPQSVLGSKGAQLSIDLAFAAALDNGEADLAIAVSGMAHGGGKEGVSNSGNPEEFSYSFELPHNPLVNGGAVSFT